MSFIQHIPVTSLRECYVQQNIAYVYFCLVLDPGLFLQEAKNLHNITLLRSVHSTYRSLRRIVECKRSLPGLRFQCKCYWQPYSLQLHSRASISVMGLVFCRERSNHVQESGCTDVEMVASCVPRRRRRRHSLPIRSRTTWLFRDLSLSLDHIFAYSMTAKQEHSHTCYTSFLAHILSKHVHLRRT